jgi:hypothetical protein
MMPWFLGSYAIFVAMILGAAVFVALFGKDADHRSAGYRVVKLIWISVSGSGGIVVLMVKLHESGLL